MSPFILTISCLTLGGGNGEETTDPPPRGPILPGPDAWQKLPDAPERVQPLPVWARMLAGMQPITTARMLELDALHRTGDRLDARFRAAVRWAAADANQSPYGRALAVADYARAGSVGSVSQKQANRSHRGVTPSAH